MNFSGRLNKKNNNNTLLHFVLKPVCLPLVLSFAKRNSRSHAYAVSGSLSLAARSREESLRRGYRYTPRRNGRYTHYDATRRDATRCEPRGRSTLALLAREERRRSLCYQSPISPRRAFQRPVARDDVGLTLTAIKPRQLAELGALRKHRRVFPVQFAGRSIRLLENNGRYRSV